MSTIPVKLPPLFERAREAFVSKYECQDSLAVGAILGAFSMACAPYRFRIHSHINSPAIWVVLVGPPSAGKTPAIEAAAAPVKDYEIELSVEANRAWRQYKIEMKAYEAALKEWQKNEYKLGTPFSGNEPSVPKLPYRSVTDATLEGLLRMHKGSLGIGVLPDELTNWLGSFGKYSNSSSRSTWLSLFSGSSINQQRADIESSREVRNPCVSLLAGIQTHRLDELRSGLADGLVYRMIFFISSPKKKYLPEIPVRKAEDDRSIDEYRRRVISFMNSHKLDLEPTVIESTQQSDAALARAINPKRDIYCNTDAPDYSPVLESMWCKMEQYMHRLAGIHSLMRAVSSGSNPRQSVIQVRDIDWAASLIELSLLPASIDVLRAVEQTGQRPLADDMMPLPLAEFVDALPEGPFKPLSKSVIGIARASIHEWSSLSDVQIKGKLRSLFKSKSTSHLFIKLPNGDHQKV